MEKSKKVELGFFIVLILMLVETGLDSSLHGEDAYTNVDFGSSLLAG